MPNLHQLATHSILMIANGLVPPFFTAKISALNVPHAQAFSVALVKLSRRVLQQQTTIASLAATNLVIPDIHRLGAVNLIVMLDIF